MKREAGFYIVKFQSNPLEEPILTVGKWEPENNCWWIVGSDEPCYDREFTYIGERVL